MACALVGVGSVGDCVPAEGGIIKSYGTVFSNITGVTITSGVISNFTMSSTGLWEEFLYDLNATANFNQVNTLNGDRSTIEQTAFMSFKGISEAQIAAANTSKDCCDLVFIHVLANGVRLVQGIERQAATGAPTRTANRSTRLVANVNTDIATNSARVEYTLAGNSNTFTHTTTLSDSAIEAL
jgi:hypothetical protein